MKSLTTTVAAVAIFLVSGWSFAQTVVSDEDLSKFAAIYMEVQMKNQELQTSMVQLIQDEGMDINRFNEIYEASISPDKEVEATSSELATHGKVMKKIESAQSEFQAEVSELITEKGMTLERYQEVFAELQSNQELQQKFGEMMQN